METWFQYEFLGSGNKGFSLEARILISIMVKVFVLVRMHTHRVLRNDGDTWSAWLAELGKMWFFVCLFV